MAATSRLKAANSRLQLVAAAACTVAAVPALVGPATCAAWLWQRVLMLLAVFVPVSHFDALYSNTPFGRSGSCEVSVRPVTDFFSVVDVVEGVLMSLVLSTLVTVVFISYHRYKARLEDSIFRGVVTKVPASPPNLPRASAAVLR